MKYSFRARRRAGEEVRDVREAADPLELARALRAEGLTLILATPVATPSRTKALMSLSLGRVSLRDKILFADNLGSMITAGLSLSRALEVTSRQLQRRKKWQGIVDDVGTRVRRGESLRQALTAHPDVFPPAFTAVVGAGEESGKLPEALATLATQMQKTYDLRRKVRGALMYPAVIVSAIIVIGILMMIYVIPTLTETFTEFGVELPLTTRLVIAFSNFVSAYRVLVALVLIAFMPALYFLLRIKSVHHAFDRALIRVPFIGGVVQEVNAAVTMRNVSSLITAGIAMVEALRITEDVLQNSVYKALIAQARDRVQRGVTLSSVFREAEGVYPILVAELTAVGEETGDLPAMLEKGALFYEKEVDQITKNLSTVIEPLLMILMGIAVGFFAVAMLSPLYSLTDAIR